MEDNILSLVYPICLFFLLIIELSVIFKKCSLKSLNLFMLFLVNYLRTTAYSYSISSGLTG